MNTHNINRDEYAKLASGFYPSRFNAAEWVSAIKTSGAKYICITSRHHDSFSMFDTKESDFNIVDATPFKRDVLKELAEECQKQGIKLHFYYSHLDWFRDDYPEGNTGHGTGRPKGHGNWESYYKFMNKQLTELLTNYGPVGAIWFDGIWDQPTNFNWQLEEFEKVITHIPTKTISGKTAFRLYDTFGFPIEMTEELAHENGFEVDVQGYEDAFKEHQKKSQAGAEQKFHGGLADNSEETAKLHTATHLLHSALMKVLGGEARQRGSNITAERLRFDFGFDRAMTADEIKAVEDLVNEQIKKNIPVVCEEMTVDEAKAQGAIGIFDNKYGEKVKVYTIGDFSKEICGGPHANNTGDLKSFKITKEQSSSAGVRRIKAVIGQ